MCEFDVSVMCIHLVDNPLQSGEECGVYIPQELHDPAAAYHGWRCHGRPHLGLVCRRGGVVMTSYPALAKKIVAQ